jgi:hypothetical protein
MGKGQISSEAFALLLARSGKPIFPETGSASAQLRILAPQLKN